MLIACESIENSKNIFENKKKKKYWKENNIDSWVAVNLKIKSNLVIG